MCASIIGAVAQGAKPHSGEGCKIGPADVEVASAQHCLDYSKTLMKFGVDFPVVMDSSNAILIGSMLDQGKEFGYETNDEEAIRMKFIKRAEFRRGQITLIFNCDAVHRAKNKNKALLAKPGTGSSLSEQGPDRLHR